MYFYELHEGDNEVYSDLLLVHDSEYTAEEFFELVQSIRLRIKSNYEHDTLIEAIAAELEEDHDFIVIGDDRLTAAVNVSKIEDDNFLADLEGEAEEDDDDVSDDDLEDDDVDFRTVCCNDARGT